jgi:hypothetical protein
MSSEASYHWSTICYKALYLSLKKRAEGFDWIINDLSRSMSEMINNIEYPIIELSGKLFFVVPSNQEGLISEYELFTDGGETLNLNDLSTAQKKRVLLVAQSKVCQCQICKFYRSKT